MKRKLVFLVLVPLLWSCKQKTDVVTPKQEIKKEKEVIKLSPIIREIALFADISLTDSTNVNTLVHFRSIDKEGMMESISMEEAVSLYRRTLKSGESNALPIFEIKNTDYTVLLALEKGYGGTIWGKLLVDRTTLEIKKIEFDHKAESEGYGDGISFSSFENQFVGAKIDFEANTFALNQAGKTVVKGNTAIDGISGATTTSAATIKMVNDGLKKHRNYLKK
ncbi:hypothetical protein DKG77_06210 [Flagellimonas aquimarina]|uniref:FMN-binding domain-containing protein n=1 Tax=Flagellimonas aquimarina TaxID=2201895 RepID=A0A316L652_9FLAO|nr:FMN-binding protein [Allomuricauda koreensis]PWL40405.1 hypothetical protein DKG77_06210 [Allomuricauda koreensis]